MKHNGISLPLSRPQRGIHLLTNQSISDEGQLDCDEEPAPCRSRWKDLYLSRIDEEGTITAEYTYAA